MMKRSTVYVLALAAATLLEPAMAQSPSPLLAIDQHRATVVERIVSEWGDRLTVPGAGVNRAQLEEILFAMRADELLAASLAGSSEGLRDVLAHAFTNGIAVKPGSSSAKTLGDNF